MSEDFAKAGKMICVDEGSYSDYSVVGFFVVLRDFSPKHELDNYIGNNQKEGKGYNFKSGKYLAELIAKGLLMEVDYGTLYLGSTSSCEDFSFRNEPDSLIGEKTTKALRIELRDALLMAYGAECNWPKTAVDALGNA